MRLDLIITQKAQQVKGFKKMSYEEFKKAYKWAVKNFPEVTNLYEAGYKITEEITEYIKSGSTWRETTKTACEIDYIYYMNVVSSVPFFRNLGGSETVRKAYTIAGYIPTEILSTSPERSRRTRRHYKIERV